MGHIAGLRRPEAEIILPAVEGLDQRKKDLDIGAKADIAQNARFGEVGSVTKRSVIGRYNGTAETAYIAGVYRFYRPGSATGYLLQVNSTTLKVGDDSAKTFGTTLWTYTGTPTRMMAVVYQDLCYVATDSTNAADNVMVTDGVTAWELGACKAVISSSAGLLDTTVAYQYSIGYNTNSDGTSGTATIQGAIVKVTSGDGKGIDLTNIPLGNSSQGSRVIYRTQGGETQLEMVHILGDNTATSWTDKAVDTVAVTGVTDGSPDAIFDCASVHGLQVGDRVTLSGFDPITSYNHSGTVTVVTDTDSFRTGQAYDTSSDTGTMAIGENMDTVTDDVPRCEFLYVEQERLFLTRDNNWKSHIYYSDQYLPHWIKTAVAAISASADATGYYDVIAEDDGDVITGMVGQLGTTYVFKQNSIRPYYIKGTPGTWSVGNIASPIGSPAPYSIQATEYGVVYQGWHFNHLFNGQHSTVIADGFNIDDSILGAHITKSFGYYWKGLYLLAYTDRNAGNAYHDRVMVYDMLRKQISIDKGGSQSSDSGDVNINCFTSFKGETEWDQLYAGDSNLGWVYEYEKALIITQLNTVTGFDAGTHYGTLTATDIDFVDGAGGADTITSDASAFLTSGFIAGQKIWVTGSSEAANNKEMTIVSVVAGTITLATGIVTGVTDADTVTITSYQTDAYGPEIDPKLSRPMIDDMETYSTDTLAQAAWVSNDKTTSNLKLLLHCDGVNGSTTFTDSSLSAHTVTAEATAQVDTTEKKWGTGSLKLDGNSDYLTVPDSDDFSFGAGNFTVDFWVRFGNIFEACRIFEQYKDAENLWWVQKDDNAGGNKLGMRFIIGEVTKGHYGMSGNWSPSLNTWYHLEFVRNGATALIFIDGVSQSLTETVAFSTNDVGNVAGDLYIGQTGNSLAWVDGHMDEMRISKGIARHTANFDVPTGAGFGKNLESYSENTIINNTTITPSNHSLRIEASILESLDNLVSKTIPEINLAATAHDRILVDVYASRSGTQFQLGFGETGGAFTDNLINVPVTTANTWETMVLDFSGKTDANRDKIIYAGIKITNADADNLIYIDNIRTGFVGTATYTSPVYNINASGGILDKLYWNEGKNTKTETYANDVKFYIRLGSSSANCVAASWSSALSDPSGTDISGTSANDFFQIKCELIGTDATEYLYFPYLYKSGGYVVKATYYQAGTDAEDEVTFRYSTGFRNYGKPLSDKIYKKVVSMHEGTDGVFSIIATTDLQDEQVTTDNSPNTFNAISLSTYPKRWTSNFPSNMMGRELKLEWYKSDVNDFKVKQYGLVVEALPVF